MKRRLGIVITIVLCFVLTTISVCADDGIGQNPDYVTDYYMIVQKWWNGAWIFLPDMKERSCRLLFQYPHQVHVLLLKHPSILLAKGFFQNYDTNRSPLLHFLSLSKQPLTQFLFLDGSPHRYNRLSLLSKFYRLSLYTGNGLRCFRHLRASYGSS